MGVRLKKYGIETVGIRLETKDTNSIDLSLDSENVLEANVKLLNSDDNAIKELEDGLFVDIFGEIDTLSTKTLELYVHGKGMTLKEIYDNGIVFSHDSSSWSNIYSESEASAWYYDNSLASFVQPNNTSTFTGFVTNSQYKYRTYTHQFRMISSNSDDDMNGAIIGYCVDDEGHPHTLSAWVWKGNSGNDPSFQIWYDYALPDAVQVYGKANYPTNWNSYQGWSTAPNGIVMYVNKAANMITVTISDWNSTTLNSDSTYSFDLNNYTWGSYFSGNTQYGYCNQSQAYSSFADISFTGKGPLQGNVIVSSADGNGITVNDDGLYIKECDCAPYTDAEITQAITDILDALESEEE